MLISINNLYVRLGNCFSNQPAIFTNVLGVIRSLFALSLLITFAFSEPSDLFIESNFIYYKNKTLFSSVNFFYLFDYHHLWIAHVIIIATMLVIISGYFYKITSILHWWFAYSYINCSNILEGGDQIISIITLLLIPIIFLDRRKNHWATLIPSHPVETGISLRDNIAQVFLLLIKIQIAFLYLNSFIGKISTPVWKNGTALYYWFSHNVFGAPRWLFSLTLPILSNRYLCFSFTWLILFIELFLFTALWASSRYKKIMIVIGMIFHFFIILYFGLVSFFFAMAGCLFIYLYPIHKQIKFINYGIFRNSKI